MPTYLHYGLYFTAEHVNQAYIGHNYAKAAWDYLNQARPDLPLSALILNGLRYRFSDDQASGEEAITALSKGTGLSFARAGSYFEAVATGVTLAHACELVRHHPGAVEWLNRWRRDYLGLCDELNHPLVNAGLVEHLWLGLLNLVSGIVLEADDRFETGTAIYRQAIQNEIRPEGYLPRAVEGGDGGSLYRELLSVAALALMAESAAHVGVNLWDYNSRGISVNTACAYLIYYYYYPEQWRWDTVAEQDARALYKAYGGFFEMLNRRTRPKDLKLLLDDLRPFFNAAGGGLTTLTHGVGSGKKELLQQRRL
jgi:hypothetical protein